MTECVERQFREITCRIPVDSTLKVVTEYARTQRQTEYDILHWSHFCYKIERLQINTEGHSIFSSGN